MTKEIVLEQSTEKTESEIAMRMFTQASAMYPASITGQSAMIARLCQEQGRKPLILSVAFGRDRLNLCDVTLMANKAHRLAGAKVDRVYIDRVVDIIYKDFERAHDFIILPTELLLEIESKYADYAPNLKNKSVDDYPYRVFADNLRSDYLKSMQDV